MHASNNPQLQIRHHGGMWRVYQGERVLAFAATYRHAQTRVAELERPTLH